MDLHRQLVAAIQVPPQAPPQPNWPSLSSTPLDYEKDIFVNWLRSICRDFDRTLWRNFQKDMNVVAHRHIDLYEQGKDAPAAPGSTQSSFGSSGTTGQSFSSNQQQELQQQQT